MNIFGLKGKQRVDLTRKDTIHEIVSTKTESQYLTMIVVLQPRC